jgi:hypothetical protein
MKKRRKKCQQQKFQHGLEKKKTTSLTEFEWDKMESDTKQDF